MKSRYLILIACFGPQQVKTHSKLDEPLANQHNRVHEPIVTVQFEEPIHNRRALLILKKKIAHIRASRLAYLDKEVQAGRRMKNFVWF